jgi:hypothetical protein
MALFFDHPFATVRREFARRMPLGAPEESAKARIRRAMPDHICLRLVTGWLVTLTALLGVVLALRWYA